VVGSEASEELGIAERLEHAAACEQVGEVDVGRGSILETNADNTPVAWLGFKDHRGTSHRTDGRRLIALGRSSRPARCARVPHPTTSAGC